MNFENKEISLRERNKNYMAKNDLLQSVITKMCETENFLNEFGFLSFGRDYILCGEYVFSLQQVIISAELTVGSIISCCQSGCIADANSLLRKYRDDLFFYLYIVAFDVNTKQENNTEETKKMKKRIENWCENKLCNLSISEVMRSIGSSYCVKEAVQNYKLQSFFDDLGNRLNNYVHSNGISYYNKNIMAYSHDELLSILKTIEKDLRFITISFLFLIILFSPLSIMSTDYIDSLDLGLTPEENSQYWVAPFVEIYLKDNISLIDPECLKYLRDNTPMML